MTKNFAPFVAGAATTAAAVLVVFALRESPDQSSTIAEPTIEAVAPDRPASTTETPSESSTPLTAAEPPLLPAATPVAPPVVEDAAASTRIAPIGTPLPIPVTSRELEAHLEQGTLAIIHAEIDAEPFDSGWATTTENQIVGFYASQPEITAEYGFPSVYCRSTLCEIQVVARGASPGNWLRLNGALFDQPWADQFGDGPVGYGFGVSQQGDTVVVTHWIRRKESEIQASEATSAVI